MKHLLLFLLLSGYFLLHAGDTTHISAHNRAHWAWYGNKDTSVLMPDRSKTFRKIILHYVLGCPQGKSCSGWDYTTKIEILRNKSQADSDRIEMARVITPYGSYYNDKWSTQYDFDVTDY